MRELYDPKESKAEFLISKYLNEKKILFVREHTLQALDFYDVAFALKKKGIVEYYEFNYLRCDFYFPQLKIVIEYDGAQHTDPVAHRNLTLTTWKKDKDWYNFLIKENSLDSQLDWEFQKQKEADLIKEEYLKSVGIKLHRINHDEDVIKRLNDILDIDSNTLF